MKTPTAHHEQPLSIDEHAAYRRTIGKLQWMTYGQPDEGRPPTSLSRGRATRED